MKCISKVALMAFNVISLLVSIPSIAVDLRPMNKPLLDGGKAVSGVSDKGEKNENEKTTATKKSQYKLDLNPMNKPLLGRDKK